MNNAKKHGMEILITVPPWAVSVWDAVVDYATRLSTTLVSTTDHMWSFFGQQRNVVGLVLSVVFFYPLWAYCFVAVTTASTWVVWLLASVLVGLLQMIYVAYQFVMIATDVFVLTLLKTYQTMMRSGAAQMVFFFNKRIRKSRERLSRRKQWRQVCETATSYHDFLRIPVWESKNGSGEGDGDGEEDGHENVDQTSPMTHQKDHLMRKSFSFATMDTLKEEEARRGTSNNNNNNGGPIEHTWSHDDSSEAGVHEREDATTTATIGEGDRDNTDGSPGNNHRNAPLKRRSSFPTLKALQEEQDRSRSDHVHPDIEEDLGLSIATLLLSTTARLKEERVALKQYTQTGGSSAAGALNSSKPDTSTSALEFLLSGVVKRNHLNLEDLSVDNARTVAVSGQYAFSRATRKAIAAYYEEVTKGLECLVEAPCHTVFDHSHSHGGPSATTVSELQGRIQLLRKMKQNTGRTALMLSGGGAQAMYHLGTVRALIQSQLYQDIRVISGTSGGAIAAACCACFTEEEMMKDICVPTVSTDYRRNGEMKRRNIRWFPPVADMISYWFENKLLVDSKYFFTTCEFYWGNTTFAEAFEHTGKHVCIHVSASRASSGSAQRLLLNHISTPHVTLASAVAASCALPGVMKPRKLQAKNSLGKIEDFEVDGVEWIDGSVQADIPFQRISTLFNVSNYIVCQTNFHVLPFLNKEDHPHSKSTYWKLFQTIEWDIRNRVLKLSRLGLFPTFFGQDISKVFKQKYHGNITLVPRFTTMQTFGLAALVNPSVRDMENYLKYGQLAAWPYLRCLRDMLCLERSLDEGLDRLKARIHELRPESDLSETGDDDDMDSIASSTVHYHAHFTPGGRAVRFAALSLSSREMETMQSKLSRAQEENRLLRQEAQELRKMLSLAGLPFASGSGNGGELLRANNETADVFMAATKTLDATTYDGDDAKNGEKIDGMTVDPPSTSNKTNNNIQSEGGVFNLLRKQQQNWW